MHLTPRVVHNFPKAAGVFLSPMYKKFPGSYLKKRRGQTLEFWSLISTIDGRMYSRPTPGWCGRTAMLNTK